MKTNPFRYVPTTKYDTAVMCRNAGMPWYSTELTKSQYNQKKVSDYYMNKALIQSGTFLPKSSPIHKRIERLLR